MTAKGSAVIAASARVWVPTALALTAAQTLLVWGDPVPSGVPLFVAAAIASGLAFALALGLVARAMSDAAAGTPVRWRDVTRPHWAFWWALVSVVLAVLLSVLSPYLSVIGIILGLMIMPPAASGQVTAPRAALRAVKKSPGRFILLTLVVVIVWVLSAVGMLVLGLFVTGAASVAATWLVLALVGVVVLAAWTRFSHSSTSAPAATAP